LRRLLRRARASVRGHCVGDSFHSTASARRCARQRGRHAGAWMRRRDNKTLARRHRSVAKWATVRADRDHPAPCPLDGQVLDVYGTRMSPRSAALGTLCSPQCAQL
jgi:hypothetical protein